MIRTVRINWIILLLGEEQSYEPTHSVIYRSLCPFLSVGLNDQIGVRFADTFYVHIAR
jgi:hypothetical protein